MSRKVVMLVFAVLMVGTVQAQEPKVIVEVKGLACPYCAYGLEKQFKEMPGVTDIKIDVELGLLTFTWASGDKLDKKQIRKSVKDAGFTAGDIVIRKSDSGNGTNR